MDVQKFKPELKKIAEKYGIDMMVLFGSQATGKTHPKSDVDIAVLARTKFDIYRLMIELYEIFKRSDVEVVDLSSVSPTLMRAVARDGRLIYEKHPGAFLKWKVYVGKIWMETAWLRILRDRKLIKWAKDYRNAHAN